MLGDGIFYELIPFKAFIGASTKFHSSYSEICRIVLRFQLSCQFYPLENGSHDDLRVKSKFLITQKGYFLRNNFTIMFHNLNSGYTIVNQVSSKTADRTIPSLQYIHGVTPYKPKTGGLRSQEAIFITWNALSRQTNDRTW